MVDRPDPATADLFDVVPVLDAESEFTYFRISDSVAPDTYVIGVVRERFVDGHSDSQVFTRSEGWRNTIMPITYRRGLLENDLVEISPTTARELIAELQAAWRR